MVKNRKAQEAAFCLWGLSATLIVIGLGSMGLSIFDMLSGFSGFGGLILVIIGCGVGAWARPERIAPFL